jgi:DNA-binding MarR family transcriptional regulator
VADLAAEFAIGIGATSKGIDRLEKQAWVIRRTNPSDRRSSLLDLTDDGLQLVEAAEATFTETLAELTAGALGGPSGLAAVQVLSELRSVLERDQIGLPTG